MTQLRPLLSGNYFKQNPNKILGEVYATTDRFGKPIEAVRGTMEDVIKGIRVPEVRRYEHFKVGQKLTKQTEKIKAVLAKTKAENRSKTTKGKCREGLQCLGDTIKKYNQGISAEAMKVWVTYQTNRGLFDKETILQNVWKQFYVDQDDYLKSQLDDLVFVIPSSFLDGGETSVKKAIAQKSKLLDAYRLPKSIFKQTDIQTDIIVLQKTSS